ncbi:metal ABC transporter permease [Aneurinibacillus aneurinilyticus]|jgi:manganese/zinc/iron transport system permease protein|uniref:Manganese transport system membrane protein MntC n=1 Tax=Aneurinibacillus aneurinilyticus ATCC 12856 TaxID=649747 RepID=U1YKY6_ANEAE|nr:iron chelate uptake ABC transporter family permease subunit [Aneurinibacillus aneurinilyticus]ERI11456.1 ABC 3 transport family protein [Aneurinibacillus aneurinilyticus ATCC 12856]MCI1694219.1 metal ABC transporter permease [Aneurinibacillus aneurinilyticus]MED0707753.1 iron chelate uptake ABC transporter family permease subunit [Aneurinibacillus aneurinilyticus]MED0722418.1 iron chelate uptake ABC transporter family permease subunit [Aneurinibacillus aneurinilyticus]MED0733116.1 iron chel
MDFLLSVIQDPNARWVIAGCFLLGISSGVLGCFAFLRKQSLMGDVIAHAALPGICLAFMLQGEKNTMLFMLGALGTGLLGTWCVHSIVRHSRIKSDTALGIVLSVFFGFGTVLLTGIAQTGAANQSGLDAFLFGKAASLVQADVSMMATTAGILLVLVLLLFKEFKLLCFDSNFGRGLGFPMGILDAMVMLMIVLTVVIGLQAVGVVLMSAMLIIPPLAARYWTEKLSRMVLISGIFGAISGVFGTIISGFVPKLSTGPVIVLAAAVLFLFSMLAAPRRGLIVRQVERMRVRRRVAEERASREAERARVPYGGAVSKGGDA